MSVVLIGACATLSAAPPPSRACLHLNSGVWGSDVKCEDHTYATSDGYILQAQHISKHGLGPRAPVILHHGLVDSGFSFAVNRRDQSLAGLLVDRNYSVWLANSRGRPPLMHTTLKPTQAEFWDFSWDEMAAHDLPATIDHVLNATNETSLFYVGHSQGTTLGFVAFSDPAIAAKVRLMVALAPVGLLEHSILIFSKFIQGLFSTLCGEKSPVVGPRPAECDEGVWDTAQTLLPKLCRKGGVPGFGICIDTLCDIAGCASHSAYNETTFPELVFGQAYLVGTSAQNLQHYLQMMQKNASVMRKYDYGSAKENRARYNATSPPIYDLSAFGANHTKLVVYQGSNDHLADPEDVQGTLELLGAGGAAALINRTTVPGYGHGDFLWSTAAAKDVYHDVCDTLDKYRPGSSLGH